MFGAWNNMAGNFGLRRSIRVYVWWNELIGRQFWSKEVNSGLICCMELDGRQFWSMEVNSGVCLVHGIRW